MSKHVSLTFELKEWAADGETLLRQITVENYGDFANARWAKGALLPHELAALQKITEGLREMIGECPAS